MSVDVIGPHLYIALTGLIVYGIFITRGCALHADPGLLNDALSGLK